MSEIRPQPAQERALSNAADVLIYGGAAGGGKSFALLLEAMRHSGNPRFGATIFRRTSPRITAQGGLLDQSMKLYPAAGAKLNRSTLMWTFPSGARVKFAHMQHEDTVLDYMGSELALIGYDEITEFTERQFWFLFSRNRSLCGIRPYIRCTCNPDADSWVARLIDWWIDQDTGFPISDRADRLRWFVRINEDLVWANSWAELHANHPDSVVPPGVEPDGLVERRIKPKTISFIPAKLTDNPALMKANPEYLANLMALPLVERERLWSGNWKIRPAAGKVFNRAWFQVASGVPAGGEECRFWDFAATARELAGGDPDYTAGVRIRKVDGVYYVTDCVLWQKGPADVEKLAANVCRQDAAACKESGTRYVVGWEVEPGSASKYNVRNLARLLDGLECKPVRPSGDKVQRAGPLASQAEAGNVRIVPSAFSDPKMVDVYLRQLHEFPDGKKDDAVDGSSGSYNQLAMGKRAAVY